MFVCKLSDSWARKNSRIIVGCYDCFMDGCSTGPKLTVSLSYRSCTSLLRKTPRADGAKTLSPCLPKREWTLA